MAEGYASGKDGVWDSGATSQEEVYGLGDPIRRDTID